VLIPAEKSRRPWRTGQRCKLRRANGNKSQAARLRGLSCNALRYRLAKLGVPDEEEK